MYSERKGNDIFCRVQCKAFGQEGRCQQAASEANSLIAVEDICISAALVAAGSPPEGCPGGSAKAGNSAREETTSSHYPLQYMYIHVHVFK